MSVVRLFYGFQFFFGLLLWVPVFYEFQKKIGLGDAEIFSIQSIYYLVFCLLEIPTGFLADRIGHRRCMVSGAVVLVVSGLFPIFAPIYSGMLAHFVLVALARSLISGASSAYIYESLRRRGALSEYRKVEGNARAYGLLGKVALWAAVGFLMEWHLTAPYWLTLGANFLAVAFALALPDLAHSEREVVPGVAGLAGESGSGRGKRRLGWDSLRNVAMCFRRAPVLPLIMVQGIAIFVLGRVVQVNLFQPLLEAKGFSVSSYGAVLSFMAIFETIGSFLPGRAGVAVLRSKVSDLNAVYLLTFVMAAALLAVEALGPGAVLGGLAIFSFAMGLSYPIQRSLMNDAIPDSRYRATLLSVESIIDRAVNAWIAALIGGFVARGEVGAFLRLSSFGTIGAMASLFVLISIVRRPQMFLRRVMIESRPRKK